MCWMKALTVDHVPLTVLRAPPGPSEGRPQRCLCCCVAATCPVPGIPVTSPAGSLATVTVTTACSALACVGADL